MSEQERKGDQTFLKGLRW